MRVRSLPFALVLTLSMLVPLAAQQPAAQQQPAQTPLRKPDIFYLPTPQPVVDAMLDHAIGPNIIRELTIGLTAVLARHRDKGWQRLEDFRGLRRPNVVQHSKIRRPDSKEYFGGHEAPEGYAAAEGAAVEELKREIT